VELTAGKSGLTVIFSGKAGWERADRLRAQQERIEQRCPPVPECEHQELDADTSANTREEEAHCQSEETPGRVERCETRSSSGAESQYFSSLLVDGRWPDKLVTAAQSTRADGVVLFWKDTQRNGYLSNWARSPFEIDGIRYSCCEQWIMAKKARACYRDAGSALKLAEALQAIMASTDPQEHKRLGRSLDIDRRAWSMTAKQHVQLRGARAKFGQSVELAERLLMTGHKRIGEASPSDAVFGIGIAPSDPRAQDPQKWKGTNLSGAALMIVRDELREAIHNVADPRLSPKND